MKKPIKFYFFNALIAVLLILVSFVAIAIFTNMRDTSATARWVTALEMIAAVIVASWFVFKVALKRWDNKSKLVERQNHAARESGSVAGALPLPTNPLLKTCKACGVQISKTATKCPSCGHANVSRSGAIAGVLVFVGVIWFFFGFHGFEKKVAGDLEDQYELAKKGGSKMDICIHAGSVAFGFNQAKDEANYLKWKEIQRADCKDAGIPVR